jgi:hypothetical protein
LRFLKNTLIFQLNATPVGVRKASSVSSRTQSSPKRTPSAEEEEFSVATVSTASNTSSSISSIQTRSRSVTPKDVGFVFDAKSFVEIFSD